MSRRRVVITGIGLVSALGTSPADFWRRLAEGVTGVRAVERFPADRWPCRIAAEVPDANVRIREGRFGHEVKRAGKFVHYAVAAAEDALADAALELGAEDPAAAAVYVGTSTGGLDEMESAVLRQEARGPRKISPYQITSMLPNMAAALISLRAVFQGPHYTLCAACASGSQAIGEAFRAIRAGTIDCALAGGSDGVLTPIAFSSFGAMRMLTSALDPAAAPRPFDTGSDGTVLGEGAAVLVLETQERAARRGARIYGEVSGYASFTGTHRIALQATADTLRCMDRAMRDAALAPSEIDYVVAQSAGVKLGDESELEALEAMFPSDRARPAITSIKGHVGHTFAASGPLNVISAVGVFAGSPVPATRNLTTVDARFAGLDVVQHRRQLQARHALINTYGFGGCNASLVVSPPPVT